MQRLQVSATFPKIAPGDLAQFKDLASRILEITKGESGNTQFDWFFNQDETSCVVRETYESSDAVLVHVGNVNDLLGQLIGLGNGIEIDVFGSPSAQLLEATAALRPTVYSYFQGK